MTLVKNQTQGGLGTFLSEAFDIPIIIIVTTADGVTVQKLMDVRKETS